MKHPDGNRFKDMTGKRFGRWTVLRRSHQDVRHQWFWWCRCRCGVEQAVWGKNLRLKHSRSCGCLQRQKARQINRVHGLSHTRFERIWSGLQVRCTNIKRREYAYYGARGVYVGWPNFLAFKHDMYVSYCRHVAKYGEANTTLDRRDGAGPYNKKNCRWATRQQQSDNKMRRK